MFRSSIFNFESLHGFRPRIPSGLLLAAALVFGVELGVRLAPDTWLIPYYSRLGFRGFMEHEVLPKFNAPKIAVFGTSRAADAIKPNAIDDALKLPEYSTVNLSIFGSRTSDWLDLYQRNRAKLSHCKLVIVVVDEWSFSSGVGNDEQFCLDAPLADRLNFVEAPERANLTKEDEKRADEKLEFLRSKRNRLLADWAFNMRLKLGFVPLAVAKSLHLGKKREPVFDEYHMVRSTSEEKGKEDNNPLNYHERIRNFYKYFDTHTIYTRHIADLAELIKKDGGHLLLLQLPNRHSYQGEVDTLFPREYEQHIRATRDLASRVGASFYFYKFPEEIGLKDSDYVDYCHLAMTGTDICTNWVIGLIEKDRLLK
jgi:hypothetical protein